MKEARMRNHCFFISKEAGEEIGCALKRHSVFVCGNQGGKEVVFYDAVLKPDWGFLLNKTARALENGAFESFVPVFIVNDQLRNKSSTLLLRIPSKLTDACSNIDGYSISFKNDFLINYIRYVIMMKGHGKIADQVNEFFATLPRKNNTDLSHSGAYVSLRRVLVLDEKLQGHISDTIKIIVGLIHKISVMSITKVEVEELRAHLHNLLENERQTIWKEAF